MITINIEIEKKCTLLINYNLFITKKEINFENIINITNVYIYQKCLKTRYYVHLITSDSY